MQCCVTGTSDATEFTVEMILTLEVHHKVVVNQMPMWKEGVSAANPYCVSFVYWSMFYSSRIYNGLQEVIYPASQHSPLFSSVLPLSGHKGYPAAPTPHLYRKAILKGLLSSSIYLLPSIKSTLNVTFSWWLPWVLCESAFLLFPHH